MIVFIQPTEDPVIVIYPECLECGGVLLAIVNTDADLSDGFLFFLVDIIVNVLRAEHVIDQIVKTCRFSAPYPSIQFFIGLPHHLSRFDQRLSQPLLGDIFVGRMDVDAIRPFLHLPAPLINRGVRISWRIVQVYHLEAFVVASDKGCLYVAQLIFALSVIEEFCQLIQDDQLDRMVLVDDTFRVIYSVRTREVHRSPCLAVSDFHRALCNLEFSLRDAQTIDTSEHFLVNSLPQLIMMFAKGND